MPPSLSTRITALRATELLDTPAEEAFDRLTRLASRILRAPVALVSLVDEDRQFFKSQYGLPEPYASRRETPLSHSFCAIDSSPRPWAEEEVEVLRELAASVMTEIELRHQLVERERVAQSERLVQRLWEALESTNTASERPYALSMSVGVAVYDPEHPRTIDEMLSAADAAMYEQKHAKKDSSASEPARS